MDAKEAVAAAKQVVVDLYADEQVTNLGLEEIERGTTDGHWTVALAFSRPWNTPRTRAQEVLENLGGVPSLKRSYKVITLSDSGHLLSIKDRERANVPE